MKIAIRNKRFWMSNIIIIVSLCMAIWFPTDNAIQSIISGIIFLIVLPFLFIRFFLKEKAASFGMTFGNAKQGIVWLTGSLSIMVLFLAGVIHYTDILTRFIIPLSVRANFLLFLVYIGIVGIYIFIFEFFFRGFIFFVWEKVMGKKAVLIQVLVFIPLLMMGLHGKVGVFFFSVSVMALFSGCIVSYSRSILYSFLFSYISAILVVASIILFVK